MNTLVRGLARVALLAAAAVLPACKDSTGPKAGPAARLDIVAGNTQSAPAGTELPQPVVVKVTDAKGRPVKGQVVNFVVAAGGGQVFAGTSLTNDEGTAQERWTLGPVAGAPQTLEVRAVDPATGQALVFATFTATATPGAPATLVALNGDTTVVGVAGSVVDDSFAVLVRDAHGNAVPGVQVAWAVIGGGGTIVTPGTTDAQGIARTQWVLGPSGGGAQRASATASGQTVRFTALTATTLTRVGADNAIATVGSVVTATVASDAPGGLPVHWTVASGGGSVSAAVTRTVNVAGGGSQASVQWTMGPAGPQTLTASAGNLSVTIHATSILAGQRRLLATVPGQVLDADATRVLWMDVGDPRQIKIRTLSTGADVVVAASGQDGKLTPGGALAVVTQSGAPAQLLEYRAGTVSTLGTIAMDQQVSSTPALSVEGNWAAWIAEPLDGTVYRRDLQAGTTQVLDTVPTSKGLWVDTAPGGEVVYEWYNGGNGGGPSQVNLYAGGTVTPVFNGFTQGRVLPETDGVNVVYMEYSLQFGQREWLWHAGTTELLATVHPAYAKPVPTAAGGYVAYTRLTLEGGNNLQVRLRTPSGSDEGVSRTGSFAGRIDALAPDGSLVYSEGPYEFGGILPSYTRRFIAYRGGPLVDVGDASGTIVEHGGRFFLLLGGSAYELSQ